MDNTIYTALSGQTALQRLLDVTANNVANLSTAGFKRERLYFDSFFKQLDTPGKGVTFVSDVSSVTDFTPGTLTRTGNDLDVAIDGDAMFSVRGNNGNTLYTRDGRFSIDSRGNLVMTATGNQVLDNGGGTIGIPQSARKISIGADGIVSADGSPITRLGLYQLKPEATRREADGLFNLSQGTPSPATAARVRQGYIEGSNVNSVESLADMINVQRAYERMSNVLQQEHDRSMAAVKTLGRAGGGG